MIVIGEKLPLEIISIIKESSTPSQRREVCIKHNLSTELINALLRRDRNVSEENSKMVVDILKQCEKNTMSNLKKIKKYEQNGIKAIL